MINLDTIINQNSAFKSFDHLISDSLEYGYTPTIELGTIDKITLANAYDHRMQSLGSSCRAYRVRSSNRLLTFKQQINLSANKAIRNNQQKFWN